MAAKRWIERKRAGRGFRYTENNRAITDRAVLDRIDALHVPPGWRQVRIAGSERAKLQAVGIDSAGRTQYLYHPSFRVRQDRAKFDRMIRFAQALPAMRKTTQRHFRQRGLSQQKVLACIVRLMDEAYFRVGNDTSAKVYGSFGLTTMRRKHTTITSNTITFDFTGKSGQRHTKKITDRQLARTIKQLDEQPGYEIFCYYDASGTRTVVTNSTVNAYIKAAMGEEFSAKDFRTWGGTVLAVKLLRSCRHTLPGERRQAVTACVKQVAHALGNTPAITRSSYIDPRVIGAFMEGEAFASAGGRFTDPAYRPEERQALWLLQDRRP